MAIDVIVIGGSSLALNGAMRPKDKQALDKALCGLLDQFEQMGIPLIIAAADNDGTVNLFDALNEICGGQSFLYQLAGVPIDDPKIQDIIPLRVIDFFKCQKKDTQKWTQVHRREKCLRVIFVTRQEIEVAVQSPVIVDIDKWIAPNRNSLRCVLESLFPILDCQTD